MNSNAEEGAVHRCPGEANGLGAGALGGAGGASAGPCGRKSAWQTFRPQMGIFFPAAVP